YAQCRFVDLFVVRRVADLTVGDAARAVVHQLLSFTEASIDRPRELDNIHKSKQRFINSGHGLFLIMAPILLVTVVEFSRACTGDSADSRAFPAAGQSSDGSTARGPNAHPLSRIYAPFVTDTMGSNPLLL